MGNMATGEFSPAGQGFLQINAFSGRGNLTKISCCFGHPTIGLGSRHVIGPPVYCDAGETSCDIEKHSVNVAEIEDRRRDGFMKLRIRLVPL
jgi:hypothetical protein